jgi:hypothetical protein
MDDHVFIQEGCHVFVMTYVRSSLSGILTCYALPLPSFQEARHEINAISLAFLPGSL